MKAINRKLSELEAPNVKVSIISCGKPERIDSLASELDIPNHNIYVDQSREVYSQLGLKTAAGLKDIGGKGEKA
jgi:peroxiredoxin